MTRLAFTSVYVYEYVRRNALQSGWEMAAMICLTGDVHHMSLQINDQKHIPEPGVTEVMVTQRYVQLLEKHGVKATLYVCGRAFTEEWEALEPVVTHALVEVGGHMFEARFPRECFDAYGEKTGLWNGPPWYQDWDIGRMVAVVREKIGYQAVSWRAHSYMVDLNTHELLAQHGLKLISNDVDNDSLWPCRVDHGLVSHPINVIPDHDHLYHAHRTVEYVQKANKAAYGADDFGAASYTVEEWGERVLEQVEAIDSRGGVATILAHPLCHYLADRFRTLERILDSISTTQCVFARELLDVVDDPPAEIAAASAGRGERATRFGPMGRLLR